MSETKRSTAEFQHHPPGVFERVTPGADRTAAPPTRKPQNAAVWMRGVEERGGDPYNATGRHAIRSKTTSDAADGEA